MSIIAAVPHVTDVSELATLSLDKGTMIGLLIDYGGFTYHQAHCIYQEHVAPLKPVFRLIFAVKTYWSVYAITTEEGVHLLSTARGK